MTAMRIAGHMHALPANAHVRELPDNYLIELDVADFTEAELSVELLGPQLTIRGEQLGIPEEAATAFRFHERLEESFRLPDDADVNGVVASYRHGTLEIDVPRSALTPRSVPIERPAFHFDPDAEAC